MLESAFLVRLQVRNPESKSLLERIIRGFEDLEIQPPNNERRPDLLILELGETPDDDFRQIQFLMNKDAVGEVFLTSGTLNHEVLLRALRSGVKEFLSQPLNEQDVRQALEQFSRRREEVRQQAPRKAGQIVNVIGSKGGIGITTIAVNLAAALAESQKVPSVVLMDLNMPFGEIPLFLEIAHKYHWGEAIKNSARLDDSFLMNILTRHASGVYVLPSPASVDYYDPQTTETLERLLGLMKRMFSFVVIDGGHSLGGISLRLLELSDLVLLVSTLSLPCLTNTTKLLNILHDLRHPPTECVKVVINRFLKNSDISLKDATESIKQEIYWKIPNDYRATMSAINQGKPLSQVAARAPVTRSLRDLAAAISDLQVPAEKRF